MSQSLAHVALHTVFSTKNRGRVFLIEKMRADVARYMTGAFDNLGCPVIRIGVVVDHVHVLHFMSRTRTIADVAGSVKRSSSTWIKEQPWAHGNVVFKGFAWQKGYGVFSVSASRKRAVADYIDRQMSHHKRQSFRDEYRAFLKKHGVVFDERYVWD